MLQTIINSPELSAGIIILSAYVAIILAITALCTLTVNIAIKRNSLKYYNRPITAQPITTRQARGSKQIRNNRQRKVA